MAETNKTKLKKMDLEGYEIVTDAIQSLLDILDWKKETRLSFLILKRHQELPGIRYQEEQSKKKRRA